MSLFSHGWISDVDLDQPKIVLVDLEFVLEEFKVEFELLPELLPIAP